MSSAAVVIGALRVNVHGIPPIFSIIFSKGHIFSVLSFCLLHWMINASIKGSNLLLIRANLVLEDLTQLTIMTTNDLQFYILFNSISFISGQ